jgi:hypothetical protein
LNHKDIKNTKQTGPSALFTFFVSSFVVPRPAWAAEANFYVGFRDDGGD